MKKLWGNHFGGINVKRDINLKTINLEKDISNKEDYYTTKDLLNMGFKNSFIKRIKEYVITTKRVKCFIAQSGGSNSKKDRNAVFF